MRVQTDNDLLEKASELLKKLNELHKDRYKIYHVDEAVFLSRDYQKTAWSSLNDNIVCSLSAANNKMTAVLAGISSSGDLVA